MESKSHLAHRQIEAHRQQLVLTEGRAGQPCRHGGDPGNEMRSCDHLVQNQNMEETIRESQDRKLP